MANLILDLNVDLFNNFQEFHKDDFLLLPHVSLFYPKTPLNKQDKLS